MGLLIRIDKVCGRISWTNERAKIRELYHFLVIPIFRILSLCCFTLFWAIFLIVAQVYSSTLFSLDLLYFGIIFIWLLQISPLKFVNLFNRLQLFYFFYHSFSNAPVKPLETFILPIDSTTFVRSSCSLAL